ncbi:uncharacterized protein LOC123309629 [Coccinella septempunctata]|uniref:uncharacterized protein LOC123309629 n=1 Tax=Coccinella septempunctata TaxID=41139 RepID=UPI001D096A20|nr:uncharacterized protein LOC123309629 [Coccinella septempunctata]
MEIEAPTPTQDFSVLGSKPNDEDEMGKSLHEEIIVRWNTYLQKGFDKTQREELMAKYKLPVNCKMLIPPLVNKEILPCLPKSANENDHFLIALQKQLAHGLTAVGTVIETMISVEEQAENIKTLADACQLFCNIHYAISAHRKYKIIPYLNQDCRKVAKTMNIEEFLFTKNFAEAVKNEQAMRKASSEFKKTTWQPIHLPGSSGTHHSRHLNYQRPKYKGRMKNQRREEKKPLTRYRTFTKERKHNRQQ